MRIILGEAANCEHGQLGYESAHQMGNQGDELRRIPYYNKPWTNVFRATDENIRRVVSTRCAQSIDNKCIGYGQPMRATYRTEMLKASVNYDPSRISVLCDCDCSSLVNTIAMVSWKAIGHSIPLSGLETTAEMPSKYRAMPQFFTEVTSSVNLATGEGLAVGDIVVRPSTVGGGHTAIVVAVEVNQEQTGTVTTTLCLRKSPVNGKVLKYIPAGASVRIIDSLTASNGAKWYKVIFSETEGYCSARYVKLN